MNDVPPISRAGLRDFLSAFRDHLVQVREEGVRRIEADPAAVRALGAPPAPRRAPPPPPAPPVAGVARWTTARRAGPGGAEVRWAVCAEAASFSGAASSLMTSILRAAGFAADDAAPTVQPPPGPFDLVIAFGTRAAQEASGDPRLVLDRARGRFLPGAVGRVRSTYAPADLLPDEKALKKAVWEDIKAALAECGLTPPAR